MMAEDSFWCKEPTHYRLEVKVLYQHNYVNKYNVSDYAEHEGMMFCLCLNIKKGTKRQQEKQYKKKIAVFKLII